MARKQSKTTGGKAQRPKLDESAGNKDSRSVSKAVEERVQRIIEEDRQALEALARASLAANKATNGNIIQSNPKVMMGKPVIAGTRDYC